MPNGEVHHRYYKKGWWVIVPESALLSLWDWKFALGNVIGFQLGRWIDP